VDSLLPDDGALARAMSGDRAKPGREPRITFRRRSVFAADVVSVQPGHWIGDAIVAFYFACLEERIELARKLRRESRLHHEAATRIQDFAFANSGSGGDGGGGDASDGGPASGPAAAMSEADGVAADGRQDTIQGAEKEQDDGDHEDAVYLMDPMAAQMAVYAEDAEEVQQDLGDIGLDRKRYVRGSVPRGVLAIG
jgi:hypothetical protein